MREAYCGPVVHLKVVVHPLILHEVRLLTTLNVVVDTVFNALHLHKHTYTYVHTYIHIMYMYIHTYEHAILVDIKEWANSAD